MPTGPCAPVANCGWSATATLLAYHAKLTRLFGSCDVIAGSPKFVVLRATRR